MVPTPAAGSLAFQRRRSRLASLPALVGAPRRHPPEKRRPQRRTTCALFTYEGDETIDLLKEQVAKFDAQAGTTTTIDTLPGSGAAVYPDKLRTELLGGKGPDVWRIWGGQIGAPFVEAKQAMDLTPYYQKFGWDSKINTAAIEGMTFDGVKGGVPFISLGIGAWYNKAIFEKAGITADPASYAELEEANEKLLAAGTTPCRTAGKYGWHIMRLYEYLLETSVGAGAARQAARRAGELGSS